MRVLITGGGGNLGRVLAPTLEEAGYEPILMDNRDLETPHKAVRGDVRDRASLLEVFRETNVVVHAAALPVLPGSGSFSRRQGYPPASYWPGS